MSAEKLTFPKVVWVGDFHWHPTRVVVKKGGVVQAEKGHCNAMNEYSWNLIIDAENAKGIFAKVIYELTANKPGVSS